MKDCDFIPPHYHDRRRLRAAIRLRAACIGAMFLLMLLWVAAHRHRLASAEAMMREVDLQHQQVTIHAAHRRTMEARWDELRDRNRLIEQLSSKASLVLLLADLSRRIPQNVLLTKLKLECDSLTRYTAAPSPDREALPPPAANRGPDLPPPEGHDRTDPEEDAPRLRLTGIALSQVDVIRFAAAVENSPLFDRVEMKIRDRIVWGGRRAEMFDLSCRVLPQERDPS